LRGVHLVASAPTAVLRDRVAGLRTGLSFGLGLLPLLVLELLEGLVSGVDHALIVRYQREEVERVNFVLAPLGREGSVPLVDLDAPVLAVAGAPRPDLDLPGSILRNDSERDDLPH